MPQGWGGVSLSDIHNQMKGIKPDDEVEVIINSGGGSVFEGIAIFNYLRDYNVTTRIIGLAGSIASIIALAGKKIQMGPAATYMVHEPWGMDVGDEDYKRNVADQLASIKKAMVEAYQTRMPNKSEKEILDWLRVEKYITGKEAKELGIADEYNIKPQEGNYSNTGSIMKFAAMVNSDFTPKENITTTINNEVPNMEMQEQINALTKDVNDKTAQINSLNSSVTDYEAKIKQLETELQAAQNKVLESKMDSYKAEEALFVDKLIENKQIEATQKDFLVSDLVAKRLEDGESYKNMRDFLNAKPVNPLTKSQATKDKAGDDGGSLKISDFNSKDKEDLILAIVNKRAQKDGIPFIDALNLVQAEAEQAGGQ